MLTDVELRALVSGDTDRRYPDCDPRALQPHYSRHVLAMTVEGLDGKAELAEQLALRDQAIISLLDRLEKAGSVIREAKALPSWIDTADGFADGPVNAVARFDEALATYEATK